MQQIFKRKRGNIIGSISIGTAAVQTAQAVNYVETYTQEEIDELVAQIDFVLEEQNSNQDVYVKSLRK